MLEFKVCLLRYILFVFLCNGTTGFNLWNTLKDNTYCRFVECCNEKYVKANILGLSSDLQKYLYGQHIVRHNVVNAIMDHFWEQNPKKALTLSFHGWPGSGKNYVTKFIVENIYKKGFASQYVHSYMGQIHFPDKSKTHMYQHGLYNEIKTNVSQCGRQMFIFDEVDKIPAGVLNILKPLIDTHDNIDNVDYRKAIFVFLSNTGGTEISEHLGELDLTGTIREELKLIDFESLARGGAFNEDGGFQHSFTIESNLIDHYIPFLPLEQKHVEMCIMDEFRKRKFQPSNADVREILKFVTFGKGKLRKFSTTGCKRISPKVGSFIKERELYHRDEL